MADPTGQAHQEKIADALAGNTAPETLLECAQRVAGSPLDPTPLDLVVSTWPEDFLLVVRYRALR